MDMHVEIINTDLCFNPSLFALHSSHPLISAYEAGEHELIQILNRTLGESCNMLCPFNVGRSENKAQPTIIVNVDPLTCANWFGLDMQIKSAMRAYYQNQQVEVEFLPGRLGLLGGVSLADGMTPDKVPMMGDSIGICGGQMNAGTLGAYVTLTQSGTTHKGIITNYHVVRPAREADDLQDLDRHGCSLARPVMRAIQMESFAAIDKDATLADLDCTSRVMQNQSQDLMTRIQEQEDIGARPQPHLKHMLDQLRMTVADLDRKKQQVNQMPHQMGHVAAASGKAVLGQRLMDWAFIQLSDTAAKQLSCPNGALPAVTGKEESLSDTIMMVGYHPQ